MRSEGYRTEQDGYMESLEFLPVLTLFSLQGRSTVTIFLVYLITKCFGTHTIYCVGNEQSTFQR